MGKFKMSGHTLKGPNQKASVSKARDIFKTYYDEDGNKKTKQISREEMSDIQADADKNNETLNKDVSVGNFTTTTSGDDTFNNKYPNPTYKFTDQDAVGEIKGNIDSGDKISESYSNDELLKMAKQDVLDKKKIRLKTGGNTSQLQNVSKEGTRGINSMANENENTFTANQKDIKAAADLRNIPEANLNLYDFNTLENKRLDDAYRSKTAGEGGPINKKMKFGRKKK